jgi:UDP-N-acetylmuramate--alanine ligase
MIVHILRECGQDPSYIVGGVMGNTGTNAGVGQGEVFVIEADEYENMFLGLKPDIAVITNIEWDHPDFFKTPEEMVGSFQSFANLVPKDGALVVSVDDPTAALLAKQQEYARNEFVHTYRVCSTNLNFLYLARKPKSDGNGGMIFEVSWHPYDPNAPRLNVHLSVPGIHNVQNAMAALIASSLAKESKHCAAKALESFIPPARRFELRADVNGIAIIDDYAHNPMSIRAVLEAARQRYPGRQIWAVWQPHTFSRTQALFDDFIKAFEQADHVLVTDIYAAREQPIAGVTSAAVVAAMQHPDARHTPTFADAVAALREGVTAPAAVIIMSAGDAPQIGVEYLKWLESLA